MKRPNWTFRCGRYNYGKVIGFTLCWGLEKEVIEGQALYKHCFGMYLNPIVVKDIVYIVKNLKHIVYIVNR